MASSWILLCRISCHTKTVYFIASSNHLTCFYIKRVFNKWYFQASFDKDWLRLGVGYKWKFVKKLETKFFGGSFPPILTRNDCFFLAQMWQKKMEAIFVILLIFLIKMCEYSYMKVLSTLVAQTSFVKWAKFQQLAYNSQIMEKTKYKEGNVVEALTGNEKLF